MRSFRECMEMERSSCSDPRMRYGCTGGGGGGGGYSDTYEKEQPVK